MKTVANLKSSISGILTGTNLNNVTNLNGAIERAVRMVIQQASIPEATGRQSITLYGGVYDYAPSTSIFGNTIIDLRPQGINRNPWDYVWRQPVEMFDREKQYSSGYQLTFEWDQGTPIMRVATNKLTNMAVIDTMSATTGWTNGGSAGTITADGTVYYKSPDALRFTLTGNSSGYLEKTLTNSIDLTDYKGVGQVFLAIRTPSATNLTNLALRIGSSSANYTTVSGVTQGFLGAWKANDWLLVAFDLSTGSDTGTPSWSAIKYLRLTVTHAATLTNFYMGYLFTSLPYPHDLIYQTAAVFLATGSTPSQTITNDTDQIILSDPAYTLLELQGAAEICLQNGGNLSSPTVQMLRGRLYGTGNDIGLYAQYCGNNPSEELRQSGSWYDI
jgi:hypothetical protein